MLRHPPTSTRTDTLFPADTRSRLLRRENRPFPAAFFMARSFFRHNDENQVSPPPRHERDCRAPGPDRPGGARSDRPGAGRARPRHTRPGAIDDDAGADASEDSAEIGSASWRERVWPYV